MLELHQSLVEAEAQFSLDGGFELDWSADDEEKNVKGLLNKKMRMQRLICWGISEGGRGVVFS